MFCIFFNALSNKIKKTKTQNNIHLKLSGLIKLQGKFVCVYVCMFIWWAGRGLGILPENTGFGAWTPHGRACVNGRGPRVWCLSHWCGKPWPLCQLTDGNSRDDFSPLLLLPPNPLTPAFPSSLCAFQFFFQFYQSKQCGFLFWFYMVTKIKMPLVDQGGLSM